MTGNGSYAGAENGDDIEVKEWIPSFDTVLQDNNPPHVRHILEEIQARAQASGMSLPSTKSTPPTSIRFQPLIRPLFRATRRWSAGSRVWCAGTRWLWWFARTVSSTTSADIFPPMGPRPLYSKSALITSFGAEREQFEGDTVYFQGHASPGVYSRAFLEGRLSVQAGEFPP